MLVWINSQWLTWAEVSNGDLLKWDASWTQTGIYFNCKNKENYMTMALLLELFQFMNDPIYCHVRQDKGIAGYIMRRVWQVPVTLVKDNL